MTSPPRTTNMPNHRILLLATFLIQAILNPTIAPWLGADDPA